MWVKFITQILLTETTVCIYTVHKYFLPYMPEGCQN